MKTVRARIQLGLGERGRVELELLANDPSKPSTCTLAALELALWRLSNGDSQGALEYLALSDEHLTKSNTRRAIRILEAEAHLRLGDIARARKVLSTELLRKEHPDILFAMANLEISVETKLGYINQVLLKAGFQEH